MVMETKHERVMGGYAMSDQSFDEAVAYQAGGGVPNRSSDLPSRRDADNRRQAALQMAIDMFGSSGSADAVITAAKAFDEYLKGEGV